VLAVLRRGRDRGELPPDNDPELTTDLLTSPFFYRHFVAHRPIPHSLIGAVVERVLFSR
jgi:hypothetical protein